ncbi:hypothetical protein WUBG_00151 [Wuchereria bancrofti]|uniref:Uncharacterized protein n=1 Tax=Wuchereria bancrofti TaxID=6293 RepID=J9FNG7_WUCBA|nr:hypothetical protein WUBG_00151 [Wuchereria bancrofti]
MTMTMRQEPLLIIKSSTGMMDDRKGIKKGERVRRNEVRWRKEGRESGKRSTLLQNCASHTKSVIYSISLTPYSLVDKWKDTPGNGMTLIGNQFQYFFYTTLAHSYSVSSYETSTIPSSIFIPDMSTP